MYVYGFVFLFKQKTAYEMRISDWSSDVCSSDLMDRGRGQPQPLHRLAGRGVIHRVITAAAIFDFAIADRRDLLERSHRVLREELAHRVELDADGPDRKSVV